MLTNNLYQVPLAQQIPSKKFQNFRKIFQKKVMQGILGSFFLFNKLFIYISISKIKLCHIYLVTFFCSINYFITLALAKLNYIIYTW